MKNTILLSYNLIAKPENIKNGNETCYSLLGNIISNFSFYGIKPSGQMLKEMMKFSNQELVDFWIETDKTLKIVFKNVLNAKNGVVYKNFPNEVMEKSESEYWTSQILMYFGFPVEIFAEEEKERKNVSIDFETLKTINFSENDSLEKIYLSLVNKTVSLTQNEKQFVSSLIDLLNIKEINISSVPFKMNGVFIANEISEKAGIVSADNATDIIRYAAVLNNKDINQPIKYFKFNRKQRKDILRMFSSLQHYAEDIAARKNSFKALFKALRPGEYTWSKSVSKMYDELYNGKIQSFKSKLEVCQNPLEMIAQRPGVFLRSFHKYYEYNSNSTIVEILKVLPLLNVHQLLKFKKYVENINDISHLIARPKSKWSKSKIIENKKVKISKTDIEILVLKINEILSEKLNTCFPNGVLKGEGLDKIAIPSNDQEISVGRGTIYDIPEDIKFVRTASYWTNKNQENDSNFWFDNSFNFIHENSTKDSCICWNIQTPKNIAIFSGDPTIVNNKDHAATQVIDLNLEELKNTGFKYAIWNILSYNNIEFKNTELVSANLQYLKEPVEGNIFEPSKVDIDFELKGNDKNKIIAYIDIEKRQLVLLDLSFSNINRMSAEYNAVAMQETIPILIDHLKLIPTMADLVENIKDGETPFLYSDQDVEIDGKDAFVFKAINEKNKFNPLDISKIINII